MSCNSAYGHQPNQQPPTNSSTPPNNPQGSCELSRQIRQRILNASPQILMKLQLLHKRLEEKELLEFVEREQSIMQCELIEHRIPELIANVQSWDAKQLENEKKIGETQVEIEKVNASINSIKCRIEKLYIDQRLNRQKQASIIEEIHKLKLKNQTMAEQKGNHVCHKFQLDNKENHPNAGNASSQCDHHSCLSFSSSQQSLHNDNPPSNSSVLNEKIMDLKNLIKHKMRLLDQKKKEGKIIVEEIRNKNYRHCNNNNHFISTRSQSQTTAMLNQSPTEAEPKNSE